MEIGRIGACLSAFARLSIKKVITLSKSMDTVLVDYMMQFFHNLCKLDHKAGSLMIRCGYQNHMFQYERLESLSLTSAIYLCDTCRQLAEDGTVRASLMQEMMIKTIIDAWVIYIEDPQHKQQKTQTYKNKPKSDNKHKQT